MFCINRLTWCARVCVLALKEIIIVEDLFKVRFWRFNKNFEYYLSLLLSSPEIYPNYITFDSLPLVNAKICSENLEIMHADIKIYAEKLSKYSLNI